MLRPIARVVSVILLTAAVLATITAGTAPAGTRAACPLRAQAVFWTSTDWELLGEELKAQLSPCADYYISIPPLSNDKTGLRAEQDDVIRRLGPQFHPIAEVTLAGVTGWAAWVTGAPGRTWFDAGVEFRKRMAAAGYRSDLGETWLLNEVDRSTARNELPYPRAAMADLLRGLFRGEGSGPTVPGIVEIGISFSHQNIPDVEAYKAELKGWLLDSQFWTTVDPFIAMLAREVYPDARFWAVPGTSRNGRARSLNEYMQHAMNLVRAGPSSIGAARSLFEPDIHAARKRDLARQGSRPVHATVLLRARVDVDVARRDALVRL